VDRGIPALDLPEIATGSCDDAMDIQMDTWSIGLGGEDARRVRDVFRPILLVREG